MGQVHKGFWISLGDASAHHSDLPNGSADMVRTNSRTVKASIELSNTSLWKTIVTSLSGLVTLIYFLLYNIFEHIADPTDHRFMGDDFDLRGEPMYTQAEKWIEGLVYNGLDSPEWEGQTDHEWGLETESSGAEDDWMKLKMSSATGGERSGRRRSWSGGATKRSSSMPIPMGRMRLWITGHSLGGGLAMVFLAKMILSNSPLLEHFAGLLTYGMPKIGDEEFAKTMPQQITEKIFNHVYNNDIFTRVPWGHYSTPPGTLVFIDSARKIILYPPDARTNAPVPIRPISYLHLSGLLNPRVIRRMAKESWLRILARIVFPFFLNDHFDYSESLRLGRVEGVVRNAGGKKIVAGIGSANGNPYGVVGKNGERKEHVRKGR